MMKCMYCSHELIKGGVDLDSRYRPQFYSDEEIKSKKGVNSFLRKSIPLSFRHGLAWYCPSCQKVFCELQTRESLADKLNHILDGDK